MDRRTFVKTGCAAVLASLISTSSLWAGGAVKKQPNLLLIYTDDQRFDALGVAQAELGDRGRFPWLKTPQLDRLAASGLRFRESFVVNAVCSPSRACTLTGTYNHLNGVRDNVGELPADNVTVGTLLKEAGYTTGYFGKWHMGEQFTRPGFDVCASQIGHGQYIDCPLNVNGTLVETKGWLDDVVTDRAMAFIKSPKEKPFFAVLGIKAPHTPYDHDDQSTAEYDDVTARAVPNLETFGPRWKELLAKSPTPPEKRTQAIHGYSRHIERIDKNIGRILDMLDREGLAENTLVLFTSDNGYLLGEQSMGDKRLAYEECMRVPFIARWPAGIPAGSVTDAMVLNIDIAPTLLAVAGARIPSHMQGRSLAPVFENPSAALRDQFFYEYFWEKQAPRHPTTYAVRTRSGKLIVYPENPEWNELFDLAKDPFETTNLINDPAHAVNKAHLSRLLETEATKVGFDVRSATGGRLPGDAPNQGKSN